MPVEPSGYWVIVMLVYVGLAIFLLWPLIKHIFYALHPSQNDIAWFRAQSKRFFDAGLLREIYCSDKLCICNMANQCYCVMNFIKTRQGVAGLLISAQEAEKLAQDEGFMRSLLNMGKERFLERSFCLDDKRFEIMMKFKMRNDAQGPTPDIDPEMEERVLAQHKTFTGGALTHRWKCKVCGTENPQCSDSCKNCGYIYSR